MKIILFVILFYNSALTAQNMSYCVDGECSIKTEEELRSKMNLDFDVMHSCISNNDYVLSFDDEPSRNTLEILRILNRFDIRASFFINTKKLEESDKDFENNRKLVQKILYGGHEVNNHTVNHKDLSKIAAKEISYEIDFAYKTLNEIFSGKPDNLRADIVRPPFGYLSNKVGKVASELSVDYKFVRWNADRYDWQKKRTYKEVLARLDQQIRFINRLLEYDAELNRSILDLNHAWSKATLKALPKMIKKIKRESYEFVTTSECIGS